MTGVQTCALPICFPVTIWALCNSYLLCLALGSCMQKVFVALVHSMRLPFCRLSRTFFCGLYHIFYRTSIVICFFNTFNTFNRFSTKCCTKVFVHIATLSTIQQVFNKVFNSEICLFFTLLRYKFILFNFSTASTTTTTTSYIYNRLK